VTSWEHFKWGVKLHDVREGMMVHRIEGQGLRGEFARLMGVGGEIGKLGF